MQYKENSVKSDISTPCLLLHPLSPPLCSLGDHSEEVINEQESVGGEGSKHPCEGVKEQVWPEVERGWTVVQLSPWRPQPQLAQQRGLLSPGAQGISLRKGL